MNENRRMFSKLQDQTIEASGIPERVKSLEPCGTTRNTSLPVHARSSSGSGQRSKIPTNICHGIRPAPSISSYAQDTSRISVSTLPDGNAVTRPRSTNQERIPLSKSLTLTASITETPKVNKSPINSGSPLLFKRRLEHQFIAKRKRFTNLKKELTEKQKNAIYLYNEICQLREKLLESGAKDPGKVEAITFPAESDSTSFPSDASSSRNDDKAFSPDLSLTSDVASSTISTIQKLPQRCLELCNEIMRKNSEFLNSLIKLEDSKGEQEMKSEIAQQLETHKNEYSCLESRLEDVKKYSETSMTETIQKVSAFWKEIALSREKIRQLENLRKKMTKEMSEKLDATLEQKKQTEVECSRLRGREITLEKELQKLQGKTREMEMHIKGEEAKTTQLQSSVKHLEMQLKQRNSDTEKQLKDMEKSLKNSQVLLTKTEKQRDGLETRLSELKKSVDAKEKETESRMKEMLGKLASADAELARERDISREKNERLQREVAELTARLHGQAENSEKSLRADRTTHFEKQVQDLRSNVQELTRRNEELEIALNQKQLEIEEQDRVIKERSNIMKVRDEVINLITGKAGSYRNSGESCHPSTAKKSNHPDREQVDKQISERTENLEQLYSTLETKQMQITRLEQLVEQMEIQQERAQEQRTRLEKKIAQLQLTMHYKKSHRYVSAERPQHSRAEISSPLVHGSLQRNGYPAVSGAESSAVQTPASADPRSSLRPAKARPTMRQLGVQRSKTLNSFNVRTRPSLNEVYASQVMAEMVKALEREREYDYKKRGLSAKDPIKYRKEDRGTIGPHDDGLDYPAIAKSEMRELFYNWLVEPWIFDGVTPDVNVSPGDTYPNERPTDRPQNRGSTLTARARDPSLQRQKATKDYGREAGCDSSKYRRRSMTESIGQTPTARAQSGLEETKSPRSRRHRS